MPAHIVMFSSGIGSWAAAKRVAQQHGTDNMVLLFADVKGDNDADNPHIGEDEDNYRFLADAAENVGARLVTVRDGRNIWQVFKDRRFLGNSMVGNCSHLLKVVPCQKWLAANYANPGDVILHIGIDWAEKDRLPKIEKNWEPYKVMAPLCEKPYPTKEYMLAWAQSEGLTPPRLYKLGGPHANCGGGCVKSGQAQFGKLLEAMPERFAVWEQKEQELREYLGKNISIIKESDPDAPRPTPGKPPPTRPLPLRVLRERIQQQPSLFDDLDWGGCGCFTEAD